MRTAPRARPSRSGLARPPLTRSWSTSSWNFWRRGVSGSEMVMRCSSDGAKVGGGELVGHGGWWTGAGDAPVQHDRGHVGHAEDRLGELLDDEDREPASGQFGDAPVELLHDEGR